MAKRTLGQQLIQQVLPPEVRRIRRIRETRQRAEARLQEQRTRPRITIHKLNKEGIGALQKAGITPQQLKDPDTRGGFEKVLDWVDVSRNTVANKIAQMVGYDPKDKGGATFGQKRVWMSDVLKHLGVKSAPVRAIAGFGLDLAIDPLTYLTAGATTGRAISRFLPKIKRPFYKTLRAIGAGKAPRLTAETGMALFGPNWRQRYKTLTRLAREGGKDIQKRIMGRRGGLLARQLEKGVARVGQRRKAATALMRKAGLEGRKLLRVPFTELAGPTLKVGKQARLYKALGKVRGFKFQQGLQRIIRRVQQFNTLSGNLAKADKAQDAATVVRIGRQMKALQKQIIPVARRYDLQVISAKTAKQTQRQMATIIEQARNALRLAKSGPLAPGVQQEQLASLVGRVAKTKVGRSLQRIFGPGRSPLRSQELGLIHRMTFGASAGGHQIFQKFQPLVDDFANVLVSQQVAGNVDEARGLIFNALEVGDMARLGKLHPGSPMLAGGMDDTLRRVFGMEGFQKLAGTVKTQTDEWLAQLSKLGIDVEPFENYLPHIISQEAQPFVSQQLGTGPGQRGIGRLLRAQRATTPQGSFSQPFVMKRDRLVELIAPNTGARKQFVTRSVADIKRFKKANSNWQQLFVVADMKGKVLEGSERLLDAKTLAAEQAALQGRQLQLIPKQWEMTAEWFNRGVRDKTFGGTLIGPEGSQAGLKRLFETDPARALAVRASQQQRAIAGVKLKQLSDRFGVVMDIPMASKAEGMGLSIPKDIAGDHPIREFIKEGIYPTTGAVGPRATAYPIPVTDALNRMREMFEGGEQLNSLLRATDMTLSWFKRWALFHPAYVIRNVWQNGFGVVMAGGNVAKSTRLSFFNKKVSLINKAIATNNFDMLGDATMKLAGRDVPLRLLAEDAMRYNFVGAGFTAAQTVPTYLRGTGVGAVVGKRVNAGAKWSIDAVRNLNTGVETKMRLGAWLSFIDDGMTGRQAAMKTLLAMPDLADVTKFERQFMTRIFPWYRWFKNNGALQLLHYLPQKPAFIAGVRKFQNLIEGFDERVPNNLRPEWMREAQAAQFTGDEQEGSAFLLRSWFPFEEVQSMAAGAADPAETARFLVGSARPGLKFAAELATGQDVFRQRPIQPFSLSEAVGLAPSAALGASGTPLDNLLAIRPAREYGRRVWEQPSAVGGVARGFLGGAVQPLSAERGLQEIDMKTAGDIAVLRRKIIRAKENQDAVELQSLLVQLMRLQVQRQRYGLTIPKDTQRVLAEAGMGVVP